MNRIIASLVIAFALITSACALDNDAPMPTPTSSNVMPPTAFAPSASTPSTEQPPPKPEVEQFQVTYLDVKMQKGSDGSDVMLNYRDVYVCYNRNAQGVKIHLYEMATGRAVNTYTYLHYNEGGQKCFALLTSAMCPNTTHTFIIEAYDSLTPAQLYTPGTFKTGEFSSSEKCNVIK